MRWLAILCAALVGAAAPAFATTYFVATTGSDTTGNGSSGNPWATPQFCVKQNLQPGDICTVADGSYTDTDGNGRTVRIFSGEAGVNNGESGRPITLKSTNPGGASIIVPSNNASGGRGILVNNRSWWVIEDFDIQDAGGTQQGPTSSHIGIYFEGGASNVIVRGNTIHDIARNVCSTTAFGNAGIFFDTSTNITIDRNLIYTIGRLRVGESGCGSSVSGDANDHGLYVKTTTNLVVTRNVFYDVNRGWPIQFFGGTNTAVTVVNNTFADNTTTAYPPGQILIQSAWAGASIFTNNIFYDPLTAPFAWFSSSGAGTISIDYNLTDVNDADWFNQTPPAMITVGVNNIRNTSPGFVAVGSRNYALATGSGAINVGVAVSGLTYNGTPDIGAFETFGCTSGTVTGNVAHVQCDMALNTPLAVGLAAEWTVNNSRTVTNVALSGSSAVDITFDGATCLDAQTWTVTKANGTASDSANIGGADQRLNAFGPLTLTNQCETGAAYTFTQTAGAFYEANAPQSSARQLFEVHAGGVVAVRTKWKATGADPPAVTTRLQYATDGEAGTYADVPDTYGAGNIRYVGTTVVAGRDGHTTATTERLTSEFASLVSGAVVTCFSGCEVPAVNLTQDSETEQVDIVEFDTDAAVGTTYHFRRVLSDGTVLTYAANSKPSITITAPAASGGFAYLGDQPVGLTVTPHPTQAPQPFSGSLAAAIGSLW